MLSNDEILNLPFFNRDTGEHSTIRSGLASLLLLLWEKDERFDSKRPWGNSSWKNLFFLPLVKSGVIAGRVSTFDEDEYLDDYDSESGLAVVDRLIRHMCGVI